MRRIDIDSAIDRCNLRLREILVFLEITFVVGLNLAALLGIQIFIQDVRVVVVPGPTAHRDENTYCSSRNKSRPAAGRKPEAGRAAFVRTTASECNRDHPQ